MISCDGQNPFPQKRDVLSHKNNGLIGINPVKTVHCAYVCDAIMVIDGSASFVPDRICDPVTFYVIDSRTPEGAQQEFVAILYTH
jgi:hypothetical protein